jgi:hypothetical protein
VQVTSGFVAGRNTLELVIENRAGDPNFNPMAFYLELSGTARKSPTKH